jgi:hypothetical protein
MIDATISGNTSVSSDTSSQRLLELATAFIVRLSLTALEPRECAPRLEHPARRSWWDPSSTVSARENFPESFVLAMRAARGDE